MRNRTGKPSTDDDGVKDIFGHRTPCQRQGRNAALPEWINALSCGQRRKDLHGVANNAVIRDWKIGAFLSLLMAKMVCDALHQPCAGSARRSPPPGTVQVSHQVGDTDIAFVLHPFFVFCPGREQANSAPIALQSCSASACYLCCQCRDRR